MPVYSYECEKHGVFDVTCRLSEWDDRKPCPKPRCCKLSPQVILSSRSLAEFPQAIIVHVAADGNVRFPGRPNARVPEGYQKKELRTIREVEQFERQMNRKFSSEAARHNENEERAFAEMRSQRRSELRQAMQHFSNFGRDFAHVAMAHNNNRKRKTSEVGFHVQILHFDQSNREEHRDADTGWKRKCY